MFCINFSSKMRPYIWLQSAFQSIIPTPKFISGQEVSALISSKKQIWLKKLVEFWCTLDPKQHWNQQNAQYQSKFFTTVHRYHQEKGGDETEGDHKVWCIPNSILHAYCLRHHMCAAAMYVCSKYWRVSSTHLEECCVGEHQSNFGSCHHI